MQIAAILTVTGDESSNSSAQSEDRTGSSVLTSRFYAEFLGSSLLDRIRRELLRAGVSATKVLTESSTESLLPSAHGQSGLFVKSWERSVSDYVRQGIQHIYLVRLGTYAELDYRKLLAFHVESQSPFTQVRSRSATLDIALLSVSALANEDAYGRAVSLLIPQRRHFFYDGYLRDLDGPHDFYSLVADGVTGDSGLHPTGTEVRQGVWAGPGAQIDSSAVITGPVFIGANTKIGAGCRIVGPASIERNCIVDCATTVFRSLVLQETYVGIGVEVRSSIVSQGRLFRLDRDVELEIEDRRLLGPRGGLAAFLSGHGKGLWSGYRSWVCA